MGKSIDPMWKEKAGSGSRAHSRRSSASMSLQPAIPSTPATKTYRWGPGLGGLLSSSARLRFTDRLQNAIN
jgi:hypothetical protein